MDIWDSDVRKIKCINNEGSSMMSCRENNHLLTVGEEYTVIDIENYSWYTLIRLEEIPGVQFNSVLFEEIE